MTYTAKQKIDTSVTFVGARSYSRPSFSGYGYEVVTINTFRDAEGIELVWKTSTGTIAIEREDERGYCEREYPNDGAKIQIKGTVKSIGEYKGQPQVELTRVKLVAIVEQAKTKEEIEAERRQKQIDELKDGDLVWEMPYRQYKEHYADCETLAGSYREPRGTDRFEVATIAVIIRDGRLKNSGVRGEHYSGYEFTNEEGQKAVYRAVSEDNALRRAQKEHPTHTWKCTHVYNYGEWR